MTLSVSGAASSNLAQAAAAEHDIGEAAATRAGGVAAEHVAGWAPLSKSAQVETSLAGQVNTLTLNALSRVTAA